MQASSSSAACVHRSARPCMRRRRVSAGSRHTARRSRVLRPGTAGTAPPPPGCTRTRCRTGTGRCLLSPVPAASIANTANAASIRHHGAPSTQRWAAGATYLRVKPRVVTQQLDDGHVARGTRHTQGITSGAGCHGRHIYVWVFQQHAHALQIAVCAGLQQRGRQWLRLWTEGHRAVPLVARGALVSTSTGNNTDASTSA